jgi:hypothetical protein
VFALAYEPTVALRASVRRHRSKLSLCCFGRSDARCAEVISGLRCALTFVASDSGTLRPTVQVGSTSGAEANRGDTDDFGARAHLGGLCCSTALTSSGEGQGALTDFNANGTSAAGIGDARGSTAAVTVKSQKTVTRNSQKLLPFSKSWRIILLNGEGVVARLRFAAPFSSSLRTFH